MRVSKINEVHLKVETEPSIARELADYFTFEVPGYRFMPAYKNKVVMDDCWITEKMKYWVDLLNTTKKVVKLYKEKHPYMKYYNPNRTTDFRLNKYGKGGFMAEHADNIHHSHNQQYGYPSTSLLYFLNDEYKGGEIVIADTVYKTKRNSAIMFPSNFMFPHYVNKITKGTRYSIVTWIM